MATLKAYIPEEQFAEGGKFETFAENKAGVQVPLVGVVPTMNITFQPKYFEESQYQPSTNKAYAADLHAIRQGIIVIEKEGVIQTPEDLTAIFRAFFQEL